MASPTQWIWVWVKLRKLVIDREAFHAVVHGVAKSQTQLRDWTVLNFHALLIPIATWRYNLNVIQNSQSNKNVIDKYHQVWENITVSPLLPVFWKFFFFLVYCKYYHIFIHLIYGCSFVAMAAGGKREKIKRGTFFKHAQRWWYWLKTKVKISPRAHADGGALSWTLDTNEFQCLNLPSMWSEESFLLALGHRTKCSLSRSGVRYPT